MASTRTLDNDTRPIVDRFIRFLRAHGVTVTVTSTRRSMAEQKKLYDNYRAGRSKYPAAAPGKSTHGAGVAVDLHLDPPVYADAGRAWEHAGYTWGGRFNDEIHFDTRPFAGG